MTIHDDIERLLVHTGHIRSISPRKPTEQGALAAKVGQGLIEKLRVFDGRPIKARELSTLLGISKETVLRRAKNGVYPSFRQGRTVYFNPPALIRYFQTKGVR